MLAPGSKRSSAIKTPQPAGRSGDRESGFRVVRHEAEYVDSWDASGTCTASRRGRDRFRAYARIMRDDDLDDRRATPARRPEPDGQDHVPALIDALLGLDVEEVASDTGRRGIGRLTDVTEEYKIGLVVADDVGGGGPTVTPASTPGLRETPPRSKRGGGCPLVERTGLGTGCTRGGTGPAVPIGSHPPAWCGTLTLRDFIRKGTLWPRPGAHPLTGTLEDSTTSCWNPAWTSDSRERSWSACTETRRAAPWASRPAG